MRPEAGVLSLFTVDVEATPTISSPNLPAVPTAKKVVVNNTCKIFDLSRCLFIKTYQLILPLLYNLQRHYSFKILIVVNWDMLSGWPLSCVVLEFGVCVE